MCIRDRCGCGGHSRSASIEECRGRAVDPGGKPRLDLFHLHWPDYCQLLYVRYGDCAHQAVREAIQLAEDITDALDPPSLCSGRFRRESQFL